MSEKETNKAVFRRYLEWWRSGDLSEIDAVVTHDYVGHVSAGDRDKVGLVARIEAFRSIYPDIVITIEDQIELKEKVVTRMTARGTHRPSGNIAILIGMNISRIVDGKIAEEWAVWEGLSDSYSDYQA